MKTKFTLQALMLATLLNTKTSLFASEADPLSATSASSAVPDSTPMDLSSICDTFKPDSHTALQKALENMKETGDINVKDSKFNYTPLIIAVWQKEFELVDALLSARADVNSRGDQGMTALHMAAQEGSSLEIVEALLNARADVSSTVTGGSTPLMFAAQEDHADVVTELLQAPGIDVNQAQNFGFTALIFAAGNGHTSVVTELLAKGADVNKATDSRWTALMYAKRNGHTEIASILTEAGAK